MENSLKFSIRLILSGCLLLLNNSCTRLDEDLYSTVTYDNFFKSDDEYIAALGEAYSRLVGIMGHHNGTWSIQEISTDEMIIPRRGNEWSDDQWIRMFRHEWASTDESLNNSWGELYSGITSCNQVMALISSIRNDQVKTFVSELRVLRVLFYYELLDLFGNVPIVTSSSPDDTRPVTRSREEVYTFVEKELIESLPYLLADVSTKTYGRMTKWVANSLLAKLYINAQQYTGTAQWDKAISVANEVINSGKFSLEENFFTNFKSENQGSKENIFVIPYDQAFAQGFNLAMMTLHAESQKTYNLTDQPWNGYCTVEEFYNSFDPADFRKKSFLTGPQFSLSGKLLEDPEAELNDPDGKGLNFTPEINEHFPKCLRQAGARIGKFEFALGASTNLSNDFPVFRLADIMLIKAEGLWRKNAGDATALAIVNQIRSRANASLLTSLSSDQLLAERGRELFAEGWRRQDLIRFGKYANARAWKLADAKPCLDIFPIPKAQLEAGSNLKQNPCY